VRERRRACDDSPRLQAGSFWNDTGVSSHTKRSVHAHERDLARSNSCLAWHTKRRTRECFYPLPFATEPVHSSVVCVQKNYFSLLIERNKSGNVDSTPLQKGTHLSSPLLKHRGFQARRSVSSEELFLSPCERNMALLGSVPGICPECCASFDVKGEHLPRMVGSKPLIVTELT
jgi:hypothetical protein